jgi:hypothetical protein
MKIKKLVTFTFSLSVLFLPLLPALAGTFVYEPMQPIPGSPQSSNFCEYVQAVYKFGIWTVGIAAMFMIMFGGYTYLLSAGNNAGMDKAKGFITDAIIGLILALTAYLILYIINPDLLEIRQLCP